MHSRNFDSNSSDLTQTTDSYYHRPREELVYSQIKEKLLEGRGILCLSGESGVGKSLLLQEISNDLANEVTFIYMSSMGQDFQGLITGLCEDLGLATGKEIILVALQSINKFLEKKKKIYPRLALVIDDAHQLQASVLDKLLLLSVAPSESSASFQLIMCGLPELEDKVYQGKRPRNEESMFFCYRLEKLEALEVGDFIKHHLHSRDYGNIELFTPAAISLIAESSNGLPRLIKKISNSALSAIGAPESPRITEKLIEYVTNELFPVQQASIDKTQLDNILQRNSKKAKTTGINKTPDTLSPTHSNLYDKIDRAADQKTIRRLSSTKLEIDLTKQSDILESKSDEKKEYVRNEEYTLRPTMNFKTIQRLVWCVTGLAMLVAAIFVYRSNMSNTDEAPVIANQTEDMLDAKSSEITGTALDSNQPPRNSRSLEAEQNTSRKVNSNNKQDVNPTQPGAINQPGSAARAYIADLEQSSKPIDLNIVFNHSQKLMRNKKHVDSYLLKFYAAKRGHANAAFRLGQMSDPATFSQGPKSVFKKANITQANKWYSQAAHAGHLNAAISLKKLQTKIILKAAAGDEDALRTMMQFQNSKPALPSS